jgi:protein-tyrosine kinase
MRHKEDRYKKLISKWSPNSPTSEAFKAIRANIEVINNNSFTSILVTSSQEGEGKSVIASNLATSFAQSGKKTIYIDCNLRKPTGHLCFQVENNKGITEYILGGRKEIVQQTEIPSLFIITSGQMRANPSELVASQQLKGLLKKLGEKADYIIVDSPPLNVADTISLASLCDASLLVVNLKKTPKNLVRYASNQLAQSSNQVIGIIGTE